MDKASFSGAFAIYIGKWIHLHSSMSIYPCCSEACFPPRMVGAWWAAQTWAAVLCCWTVMALWLRQSVMATELPSTKLSRSGGWWLSPRAASKKCWWVVQGTEMVDVFRAEVPGACFTRLYGILLTYCYGLPMLILSFRLSLDDARKFFLVCLVRGPVWNLVGVLSIRFRGLWG